MPGKLILGKYEPRGEVGSGGSGSVIEAWDTVILRKVAIKCIALARQPQEPQPAFEPLPQYTEPAAYAEDGSRVFVLPWEDEQEAYDRFERTNPTKVIRAQADARAMGEFAPSRVDGAPSYEPVREEAPRGKHAAPARMRPDRPGAVPVLDDAVVPARMAAEPAPHMPEQPQAQSPAYAVSEQTPGLDEARAIAKLLDENIVTLYDFGVEDDTAFLVMEYVDGVTLTKFLARHDAELTLDTIAAVFDSVAHALELAHANNVLHLDIKPDNILINRQGQVKVTDFGLASLTDFRGFGHAGGGTIGYMPPEQMHREALDARCDEWAFASILYQMLVGKNPFLVQASSPLTVEDLARAEAAIRETDLMLPSRLWDELDPAADDVLFRALDPDREDRFRTIAQFADEMAPLLGDPDVGYEDIRAMMAADDPVPTDAAMFGFPEAGAQAEAAPMQDDGQSGLRGMLARFKQRREERARMAAARQALQQPHDEAYYEEGYSPAADGYPFEPADDYYEQPIAPQEQERPSRNPLRHLKGDRGFALLGRLFAALGSAFVASVAFASIPQIGGVGNPVFWIIIACFAGAGLLIPSIAAAAAFLMLGAALCVNASYVLGVIVILATVAWWFGLARHGKARTNTALVFPVSGAVGFAPLSPLLAGYCLRPLEALATTCYGVLIALTLAGFGSADLSSWEAWNHFFIGSESVQRAVLGMLMLPQTWCIIVSWVLAAVVAALGCAPQKRLLAGFACILAFLIVLIGASAAQWFISSQAQIFPSTSVLVPLLISGIAVVAAGFTAVPERSNNS